MILRDAADTLKDLRDIWVDTKPYQLLTKLKAYQFRNKLYDKVADIDSQMMDSIGLEFVMEFSYFRVVTRSFIPEPLPSELDYHIQTAHDDHIRIHDKYGQYVDLKFFPEKQCAKLSFHFTNMPEGYDEISVPVMLHGEIATSTGRYAYGILKGFIHDYTLFAINNVFKMKRPKGVKEL